MENPIFDELAFQIFEKNEKSKNHIFRNFVHFCSGGGVIQFWVKRLTIFSFSTFYPSAKGRRELKIRRAACSARRVKPYCIYLLETLLGYPFYGGGVTHRREVKSCQGWVIFSTFSTFSR